MALLQILLLLLYALPSLLLPITSNPLGLGDTPDNLAWESQSYESRSQHEGVRKIPKSIFITPNHHSDILMSCASGYKMQDGKCIKQQNFALDPLELIKLQVQQVLDKAQTTADYDEYDYDNYGDSTESTEPLHISLIASFDDEPPNSDDGIQNMPFLAGDLKHNKETSQKDTTSTTSTETKTTGDENVVPITATITPNAENCTDDNMANNKDSSRVEQDINSTTPRNFVQTTPDESLLIFSDGGISTTQKKVLVDLPESVTLEKEQELYTEEEMDPTTTITDNEPGDGAGITLPYREAETHRIDQNTSGDHNHVELITPGEDQDILNEELQSELLFKDDSLSATSMSVSDGTTEINENDLDATTEPLNSLRDKEFNDAISISTTIMPLKSSNRIEKPIIVVPTVEQVQIVTPVQQTTTSHSTTHRKNPSTSQFVPSPTSIYNSELQTAERSSINESMLNKKLRESVMKHELNEDAIETIDTNNRFVYTHLDSSSNEPEPSSTTSPTIQPNTQRSLLEQLRFISEDSRRNNRIRFPEPAVNIFSNFKGGTIKFPGPVQQRTSEPLYNRLIPDLIPKKPPESSTERPLFSWLPAGTTFDFSRNPGITRFWSKMPLVRDRSMTSTDSADHPRSNSKSPTDNLYKDAPASEIYKEVF